GVQAADLVGRRRFGLGIFGCFGAFSDRLAGLQGEIRTTRPKPYRTYRGRGMAQSGKGTGLGQWTNTASAFDQAVLQSDYGVSPQRAVKKNPLVLQHRDR